MSKQLVCRLCTVKTDNYFEIFEDIGRELHIAEIIGKYFWFEITKPENRDELPLIVCKICWSKISDFHRFYTEIEEVQNRPSLVNIKIEMNSDENEFGKQESCCSDSEQYKTIENITDKVLAVKIEESYSETKISNHYNETNSRKPKPSNVSNKTKRNVEKEEKQNELYRSLFDMDCDLCLEKFSNFDDIRNHYVHSHNQTGYVKCCSRKYFSVRAMKEHSNRHSNPKTFICDFCHRSITRKTRLREHLLRHVDGGCKKKLSPKTVPLHDKRSCTKESYICDICGKTSVNYKTYFEHKRYGHDNKLPPVQCDVCGQWVNDRRNLRNHMLIHTDGKQKCQYCFRVLKNRRTLRKHCKEVHIQPKVFKCNLCGKEYKREINLQEHMSTHSGTTLYSCTFCTKTFNSSANMYKHRKAAHPIEYKTSKEQPSGIGIMKSAALYTLNKDL